MPLVLTVTVAGAQAGTPAAPAPSEPDIASQSPGAVRTPPAYARVINRNGGVLTPNAPSYFRHGEAQSQLGISHAC